MPTNLHPQKKEPTIDEYGIAIDQEVDLGFPSGTIGQDGISEQQYPKNLATIMHVRRPKQKQNILCLIIAIGLTKTKMVI